jgi:hypothetical protein
VRNTLLPAILITTLAVFLTGCSRSPVAPTTDPTGQPGVSTSVLGLPDDGPPVSGGTPNWRSVALLPIEEGSITVGRFTLWIRKNTLKQPATITLRVTDPEALTVAIEISPAAANDFQSPAILTANMSDVDNYDYSTGTMLYWDGAWEQMTNVSSHPNQQNVVAHLVQLTNCQVSNTSGGKGKMVE